MISKVSPFSSLSPQSSLVAPNVKPQFFSSLQPGQLLQGLVTEYHGGGQATLQTSLGQLAVRTDASLVKGQVLQLEVLSTSPQIEFGLKQDPLQTQLRSLSSFIGRSMDLGPLMQLLQESSIPPSTQSQKGSVPSNIGQSLASSIPVDNESIIALLSGKSPPRSSSQLLPLTQPVLIKAGVIDNSVAGKVMLEIGGVRFQVSGELSVKPGQDILLRIEPGKNELTFTPVAAAGGNGKTAGNSIGPSVVLANPQNSDLSPLLKALQQPLLRGIAQLSTAQMNTIQSLAELHPENLLGQDAGKNLQDNVQRIGMNMEGLLARGEKGAATASLKATLLQMVTSLQKNEGLATTAKNILSTLEMFQVAQLKLDGDFLIFPLPFSFLENGFLVVEDYPEKKNDSGDDEQCTKFSLHLTMAELGDLEVRYYQSEEGARIRFLFESEEKAAFAAEYEDDLKEMLSGVRILGISFSSGAVNPGSELLGRLQKGEKPMFEAMA